MSHDSEPEGRKMRVILVASSTDAQTKSEIDRRVREGDHVVIKVDSAEEALRRVRDPLSACIDVIIVSDTARGKMTGQRLREHLADLRDLHIAILAEEGEKDDIIKARCVFIRKGATESIRRWLASLSGRQE